MLRRCIFKITCTRYVLSCIILWVKIQTEGRWPYVGCLNLRVPSLVDILHPLRSISEHLWFRFLLIINNDFFCALHCWFSYAWFERSKQTVFSARTFQQLTPPREFQLAVHKLFFLRSGESLQHINFLLETSFYRVQIWKMRRLYCILIASFFLTNRPRGHT